MTVVLNSASLFIRLLVAAAMVVASFGVAPAAAVDGPRADAVHHVQAASAHDCCEPDHAPPDRSCGLTCAPASCGWTVPPAATGWSVPIDRQAPQWPAVAILPDDIAPETTTPPPRA